MFMSVHPRSREKGLVLDTESYYGSCIAKPGDVTFIHEELHMPMQRIANTAFETRAQHYTLLRVVNSNTQQYAFAVSDDGEDVFIPGPMVRRQNLTELDEGAGFRALLRPSPPDIVNASGDRATAKYTVIPPMIMDDQNPTFVAPIPMNRAHEASTPDDVIAELDAELNEVLDRHETLTDLGTDVDDCIGFTRSALTKARGLLTGPFDQVMKAQKDLVGLLEAMEVGLVRTHNTITEELEWRVDTYPPEDEAAVKTA